MDAPISAASREIYALLSFLIVSGIVLTVKMHIEVKRVLGEKTNFNFSEV
jgi:hypothetical protein